MFTERQLNITHSIIFLACLFSFTVLVALGYSVEAGYALTTGVAYLTGAAVQKTNGKNGK